MALKKIIDIEVNDSHFKQFQDNFAKYQANLEKNKPVWSAVNKEIRGATSNVIPMTAAIKEQNAQLKQQAATHKEIAKSVQYTALMWKSIRGDAKAIGDVFKSIPQTIGKLAKWGGIGGGVTSLLGLGGSLWGLDALAHSGANARRSTTGLGLNYGQQTAFGNVFGRFVDTNTLLGGISQARGNLASNEAMSLYALGVNPNHGNTGDVALHSLDRVRQLASRTPENQLGLLMHTHGLGALGYSTEDLRRLKGMSDKEYGGYRNEYNDRQRQLRVTDDQLKAWQKLDNALDLAGHKIKASFLDALSPLAGVFGKLAESGSTLITSLIGSKGFKDAVEWVTKELDAFAKYVQTEEFKNDVKQFIQDVGTFVKGFAKLASVIGGFGGGGSAAGSIVNNSSASYTSTMPSREEWDKKTEEDIKKSGYTGTFAERIRANRNAEYQRMKETNPQIDPSSPGYAMSSQSSAAAQGAPGGKINSNNPGALRVPGGLDFQQFNSPEAGVRAMHELLTKHYIAKGLDTPSKILNVYAPPKRFDKATGQWVTENDTPTYIQHVKDWSGVDPNEKIEGDKLYRFMAAQTRQEGVNPMTPTQIKMIIENRTGHDVTTQAGQQAIPSTIPH